MVLTNLKNPTAPREINQSLAGLQREIESAESIDEKIELIYNKCMSLERFSIIPKDFSITPEILKNKIVATELKKWPDTRSLVTVIAREQKKMGAVSSSLEMNCIETKDSQAVLPVYKYSDLTEAVNVLVDEKVNRPLASFKKYCMQCHGGAGSFIELPLDSLEKMVDYEPSFSDVGVLERLEKKIMPPSFANLQPTDQERKEMINAIKELQKAH